MQAAESISSVFDDFSVQFEAEGMEDGVTPEDFLAKVREFLTLQSQLYFLNGFIELQPEDFPVPAEVDARLDTAIKELHVVDTKTLAMIDRIKKTLTIAEKTKPTEAQIAEANAIQQKIDEHAGLSREYDAKMAQFGLPDNVKPSEFQTYLDKQKAELEQLKRELAEMNSTDDADLIRFKSRQQRS